MTTVKFDKSVKYKGIRYSAHEAFKVNDNDVAELKKAGATVLVSSESVNTGADESKNEVDNDVAELKEELLKYTVAELIAFAQERGIDLQEKTRKADIYNIIVAAIN